jgi:ABC-type multidrug transport system fused ATPase/permease subunit
MHGLKILWSILEPRARRNLVLLSILTAFSSFFELLGVGAIIPFIAVAQASTIHGPSSLLTRNMLNFVHQWGVHPQDLPLLLGVLLLLGVAVSNVLQVLYQYLCLKIIYNQYRDMSIRLVRNFASRSVEWYSQQNSADLSQSLMNEVNTVSVSTLLPAVQCAGLATRVLFTAAFFLLLQPKMAIAIACSLTVVYYFVFKVIRERLTRSGQTRFGQLGQMYRISSEVFQGSREIRMTGTGRYFVEAFSKAAATTVSPQVVRGLPPFITRAAFETATVGITVGVVVYFAHKDGGLINGLPLLSAYALAGVRLLPAVQQAFYNLMDVRFNLPSVENLAQFFRSCPLVDLPQLKIEPLPFHQKVVFQNVCFAYPDSPPTLQQVSFTIRKMERVAFVGATGAGKSTMLDLLLQLRDEDSGSILIDDVALDHEHVARWQRGIGYVPQSIFLRDASIRENVAFGVPPECTDQDSVIRACKAAALHDFIVSELPNGYDTVVGERGSRLSGGQSQRLGIARALYYDPEIVVFDEATSSLDNVTENSILQALHDLKGKKTLVVVAHRLNTVWDFDKLLVVDKGRLVGQGTAAELSKNCPAFQQLLKYQSGAPLA